MKRNIIISAALVLGLAAHATASALDYLVRDSLTVSEFGVQEAWRSASAVSVAKSSKLQKSFTQNVMNTLYGEIPGLTVMNQSGEPGSDNPLLRTRGINTFDTSNRNVLILVDGFESTLENLSADEIESISVLKDAAATTIYGMRGANGVVLVTTKRGFEGPMKVSFSAQTGFNTAYNSPKFLDAVDYATLYNEARANDGLAAFYTPDAIAAYGNGSNPYLYPNVDWSSEVLNKVSAAQNYSLNFRGSNKNVRYFALLGISDNNGFFAQTDPKRHLSSNSKFTRYNVRSNIDVDITRYLSAHLNLAASISDKYSPAAGAWNTYNNLALITPNAFPVYNPDGSFGGNATFSNPVGDMTETGFNSSNQRTVQSDLSVGYDFDALVKGLKFTAGFSFRNWFTGSYNKSKKYTYYSLAESAGDYVYNAHSEDTDMAISDSGANQWRYVGYTFKLDYARTFDGKHAVAGNLHFFSDLNYINADTSVKDYQFPYKWMGFRGRLSYGYDKKYVAELTFNEMGSDLYAKGHKWGFFPAAALGWVVSNEDFLKDNETINYMKVRASIGNTGNATVVGSQRYAYTQNYRYTASIYKGATNTSQSTMMEDSVADPDRTWERELKGNIGIEATLWNKLDVNVDAFVNKRNHILVSPAGEIPAVLGMTFSYLNLGRSTNAGFELGATWRDKAGDLDYYLRGNLWFAKNRIDYMAEELRLYEYQYRTGQSYDQPFGLVSDGLFKDDAEIAAAPEHTYSSVKPGDIRYVDQNEDGFIDSEDARPIGFAGLPELSGSLVIGLKWKNFDFETMLYGIGRRTSYLSGNTYWAFMNQYAAPVSALDRWTPETAATATYPRLSSQANPNNTQYSDFWQVDGSFLKVRYVELGWNAPKKLTDSLKADSIRIFLNGTNLFALNNMGGRKNADPEGVSGVPQMRTVSIGAKIGF